MRPSERAAAAIRCPRARSPARAYACARVTAKERFSGASSRGPGQMANGGVRIAGGEGKSAQPCVGVGVGRVEAGRLLVLAVGGVELPRALQDLGVADMAGRVVGIEGESRAVKRQAVRGGALVDQGGEQVGPAERPRREFVGSAVGGDGLVGEGVRLEDHAVAAPGVAVSRVGAEVGLERGEALADCRFGTVEQGFGNPLGPRAWRRLRR